MILYHAGTIGEHYDRLLHAAGARNILLTYAEVRTQQEDSFRFYLTGREQPDGVRFFLDSGAFGAKTRGATIDLAEYCDFIHEHKARIETYAALDVIGDWRATAANVERMRAAGLDPLPTFHYGSPLEELDRLVRSHKRLALGGLAAMKGAKQRVMIQEWLDTVFLRLERHWPVRTHAFGVTSQWALERYPLYSADSTAAVMSGGYGRVIRFVGGELRFADWRDDVQATLDGSIADGIGMKATGLKNDSAHLARRINNAMSLMKMERHVTGLWAARGVRWDSDVSRA